MNDERPGGPIRIGDSEREDAIKRLGDHYEAGRLSADEHAERIDQALQAKTEADLAALFTDLPGAHAAGSGQSSASESGEWAGPWGWKRPPWTAASESAAGSAGPRSRPGRPGFLGRVPVPLLIALGVVGVLASVGCVVGGGHPPVLPLVLAVAGFFIVRRRRMERRA
ncbi:DUF1707 SHOCT-like domain-containing protein [Kribbella sp. NPDC055071]